MSVVYTYEGSDDTITIDFTNQEVSAGPLFDDIECQEINDAIREAEASAIGFGFPSVCETSGKNDLDITLGVKDAITLKLLDNWVIATEKTSGVFKIWAGNLLRDDGASPLKENNLVHQFVIQSSASTIVQISTGSGLSAEQNTQLMAIPTQTLETDERTKLLSIETGMNRSSLITWIDNIDLPASGTVVSKLILRTFEAPDSAPTISVTNVAGSSRNINLSSTTMTNDGNGIYSVTYTVDVSHLEEILIATVSMTTDSEVMQYHAMSSVGSLNKLVDSIHSSLDTTYSEVTSRPASDASVMDKIAYLFHAATQKAAFNRSTGVHTLYRDDGVSTLGTRSLTDNGTLQETSEVT